MHFSTYREFYQKALIRIGGNDRSILLDEQSPFTHWLIALEGQPRTGEDYFLWGIAIYPADKEGFFNWHNPIYKSSLYNCINEAYNGAKVLEQYSHNDELSSMNLQIKIS